MKKILKILVVILVLCIAYYLFCIIRANLLVDDLAEAMENNKKGKIEDLTGDDFFGSYTISDFDTQYINSYEHVKLHNKNFSYNKLGMKPYYNYILFEYEITFPDPLWVIENTKNAQEIINNIPEAYLIAARKANALQYYFSNIGIDNSDIGVSEFLALEENVKSWSGKIYDSVLTNVQTLNFKNIMTAVNKELEVAQNLKLKKTKTLLAYNVFTNKFETDGIFYYAARGFLPAQEFAIKFYEMKSDGSIARDTVIMYLSDGNNEISCEFYKDDLVWIKDIDSENEEIEKQNIYFIQNNIKKNEILEVLAGIGYEEIEKIEFYGADKVNYVEFCKDICISPEDLKGLSKDEVVERLEKEGFYLGEWEYFKKDESKISVFFYENELIWLNDWKELDTNKETENILTYIIENNLKENEAVEFLLNEGYIRVEE